MQFVRAILIWVFLVGAPMLACAAETPAPEVAVPTEAAAPAEHELPAKAVEIGRPFGFPVTNSMLVT